MTHGAGSSNSYLRGHPFLLGPIIINLSSSDFYPFELARFYKLSLRRLYRQELLSYRPH
jgi:hypothetical protein